MMQESSVDRLTTPEQLDKLMVVTRPITWLGLIGLMGLIVVSIGWSAIARIPVTVAASGILITPSGLFDVVSGSQGRIAGLEVEPGMVVESGQIIGTLDQADLEQEVTAARAQLEEAEAQLERLRDFFERERDVRTASFEARRDALRQSTVYTEERVVGLRERLAFELELVEQDLIIRQRPIDTQIEINDALASLASMAAEQTQLLIEEETFLIENERQVLENEADVALLRLDLESRLDQLGRQSTLTTPYSGRVLELKVNRGEIVSPGDALFSLLPEDDDGLQDGLPSDAVPLVAYLYAEPAEGKKVQPGLEVMISPSTVGREQYGTLVGRVRSVAEVPSSGDGMLRVLRNERLVAQLSEEAAPIEIIVDLERDSSTASGFRWSSSEGPPETVNTGTLATAEIKIDDVMLLGLALPALERLLPSAPGPDEGAQSR